MTEIQDSLYPDDWKKAAEKDWHRITLFLKDNDSEGAAFFLQQSLEKYLKAFLLQRGWKLKKTHELDTLLDYAVEFDPGLEEFRGLCEKVAGYYFTERYPMLAPSGLTLDEIETEKAETEKLIRALFQKKD